MQRDCSVHLNWYVRIGLNCTFWMTSYFYQHGIKLNFNVIIKKTKKQKPLTINNSFRMKSDGYRFILRIIIY